MQPAWLVEPFGRDQSCSFFSTRGALTLRSKSVALKKCQEPIGTALQNSAVTRMHVLWMYLANFIERTLKIEKFRFNASFPSHCAAESQEWPRPQSRWARPHIKSKAHESWLLNRCFIRSEAHRIEVRKQAGRQIRKDAHAHCTDLSSGHHNVGERGNAIRSALLC